MTGALSKKSLNLLEEWAIDEFYVYLRATSSKWSEPSSEEGIWWVVSVQVRAYPSHEFREEGRDLDVVVKRLGKRVPRRRELKEYDSIIALHHVGFLAPHALWKKKYRSIMDDGSSSDLLKKAMRESKRRRKNGQTFDLAGEGRPANATEKGWGTSSTTPGVDGSCISERYALIPPPPPPR